MAFFPLTGFIIGLLLALGFYLLSSLFPRPLALWLTIGLMVILTGGLHLDGFADTIDGLACRGTKERVLEVMRDSRVGAFGVIGLILLIGTKYLALDQLSDPDNSLRTDPDDGDGKKFDGSGLLPLALCSIHGGTRKAFYREPRTP